jgi:hypothetical protein
VVTGSPQPDHTLTCSTGTWGNFPTSFTYQWNKNGRPIKGATKNRYVVQVSDQSQFLSCTVTASNGEGASKTSSSVRVLVALPGTLNCPVPSGSLHGKSLGPLSLGMTRKNARKKLHRFGVGAFHFDDFCLFAGWGIRANYPTKRLLNSLPKTQRSGLSGRLIIILTSNTHYALKGVHPGDLLSKIRHKLKLGKVFHVGANLWYFAPFGNANGLLKVRHNIVFEVGIADKQLTTGRKAQSKFIHSFD